MQSRLLLAQQDPRFLLSLHRPPPHHAPLHLQPGKSAILKPRKQGKGRVPKKNGKIVAFCQTPLGLNFVPPRTFSVILSERVKYGAPLRRIWYCSPDLATLLIVSFSYLREADDDFLDELLGGVGGQIASLIPKDVDSQVFIFEALNLNQWLWLET